MVEDRRGKVTENYLGEERVRQWGSLAYSLEEERHRERQVAIMQQAGRMKQGLMRLDREIPELRNTLSSSRCHVEMMVSLRGKTGEVWNLGLAVVAQNKTFKVQFLNGEKPEGQRSRAVLVGEWRGEDSPTFYGGEWQTVSDPNVARMAVGVGLQAVEALDFLTANKETEDFDRFLDAALREYPMEEKKEE
jgi:hypothetical protein